MAGGRPKGYSKTGGRQKGSINKTSLPIAELCAFHGCSPLEGLIKFCSHPEDGYKFQAMKELMQYLYPKRTAQSLTLENFSLDEIEAFLKLKLKSNDTDPAA